MPSNMGRIAVLMPVVMALADRAGLPAAGPGRVGLALAVGFGTFQLSASILPANVPNLVMAGAAESAFGLHFAYLPYLALHAPCSACSRGRCWSPASRCCSGPAAGAAGGGARPGRDDPGGAPPRRLLLVTLALWMTDSVHGIPAAWIGLAAACLCLLPRIGFLSGEDFAGGVNIRTCLYIAGILGLAAVVTRTGLGDRVGRALLAVLPLDPGRPALGSPPWSA